MTDFILNIEKRTDTGKEVARKARREGKIPGVYYFHGKDTFPVFLLYSELKSILGHEAHLINITIDGKENKKCLIREIQYNPLTHAPIHVDLMGVKLDEKVTVSVPLHLTGTPDGVKNHGGILQHILREIEVECLPTDIPENIEVDVSDVGLNQTLSIADIKTEKYDILNEAETIIATVSPPRVSETEESEVEEESAEPEVIGQSKE